MTLRRAAGTSALIAIVLAALASCGGHDVAAPPPPHCDLQTATVAANPHASPPPVPASGTYLGAYALDGPATQRNYISSFNALQQAACRPLDIAHVYLRWNYRFPTPAALALARSGHYLLVSVKGTDIPEMASGRDDAVIRSTAHQLASFPYPIFIEFRWEMDRPNLATVVSSPAAYIAAWDRMRRLFAAAGVTNASWVWCPTAEGFATGRAQPFYPGDSEVDWVCTDAYPNLRTPHSPLQPLSTVLAPFLTWAKGHDKPIMIGEFGVSQAFSAEQRAQWLLDARSTLSAAGVKAAVYFDANVTTSPGLSFEIGASSDVVDALRTLATDRDLRPAAPADPAAGG
jgi:hypothetical protein